MPKIFLEDGTEVLMSKESYAELCKAVKKDWRSFFNKIIDDFNLTEFDIFKSGTGLAINKDIFNDHHWMKHMLWKLNMRIFPSSVEKGCVLLYPVKKEDALEREKFTVEFTYVLKNYFRIFGYQIDYFRGDQL